MLCRTGHSANAFRLAAGSSNAAPITLPACPSPRALSSSLPHLLARLNAIPNQTPRRRRTARTASPGPAASSRISTGARGAVDRGVATLHRRRQSGPRHVRVSHRSTELDAARRRWRHRGRSSATRRHAADASRDTSRASSQRSRPCPQTLVYETLAHGKRVQGLPVSETRVRNQRLTSCLVREL